MALTLCVDGLLKLMARKRCSHCSRTHRKINGKYNARVRYKIEDGKPLDILRQVENKSAIKPKQAEIEVELLKNGPAQLVADKVTFRQLAQHTKDNIYVSAAYDDQETKITGVRKDKKAAKKFFRKLLKGLAYVPRVLITDKLKSYSAATADVMPSVEHWQQKYQHTRAENSHQPTRLRERVVGQ